MNIDRAQNFTGLLRSMVYDEAVNQWPDLLLLQVNGIEDALEFEP